MTQDKMMDALWRTSHLNGSNIHYLETLYDSYLTDPASVSTPWRDYFDSLPKINFNQEASLTPWRERFIQLACQNHHHANEIADLSDAEKQWHVLNLVEAYRVRGHQHALLDPLQLQPHKNVADLDLAYHQLNDGDLPTIFHTNVFVEHKQSASLQEIITLLQQSYCSTIGCEYMHIVNTDEKRWLAQRIESVHGQFNFDHTKKHYILERLTVAEGLENYLASRYPGIKRFGLEGADSFIPMLDELIQREGGYGIKEIVIGMAHRGRLNLLVNILGKSPAELIEEFDGKKNFQHGSGDVKYHQGFSSNVMTAGGEIHLALAFNPSHLEIVAPVVEGSVRARQDRRQDWDGHLVLPVIVHGDAAMVGQGVVMEILQMSQTRGFKTGGTIHIVINNQIGFTTSHSEDARSTEYCTDIAKMVQAPIFHVNGDDPEAVIHVTQIAVDYRRQFHKDVVIDLFCYRRHGHNEADEPSGTQPLMYAAINKHPTVREIYANQLIEEQVVSRDEARQLVEDYRRQIEKGGYVANALVKEPNTALFVDWRPYLNQVWLDSVDTRYQLQRLVELATLMCEVPAPFVLQRQVAKVYQDRRKMITGELPINWGFAELLAYATLLDQNYLVRLTGQDCGRGTFSHRHAVLYNQSDGKSWVPLQHLKDNQAPFYIFDSILSEEGVLAFEYGYATTTPNAFIAWEAQFGDFANVAQVVIDQFISSGETKWGRVCGLTLLLPHGFEGQGPEHSSARLERFLQLCAEQNIQVVVPSTPAQMFHLIRRQVIWPLRKPLIVMQPKSLLRHKAAVSSMAELAQGTFKPVLTSMANNLANIQRVILSAGKVYFDLLAYQQQNQINDTTLLRLEQLYPFPESALIEILQTMPQANTFIWCQEEPENQGAWLMLRNHLQTALAKVSAKSNKNWHYVGRPLAAAPAVGYPDVHKAQQALLIKQAFSE